MSIEGAGVSDEEAPGDTTGGHQVCGHSAKENRRLPWRRIRRVNGDGGIGTRLLRNLHEPASSRSDPPLRTRPPPAILVIVGVYAILLGWLDAPSILADDAAISFRYASRIAEGLGFTYNDHERVLGASNPLFTLVLALPALGGFTVEAGARVLCLVVFAGAAMLAALLAGALSRPVGALVAGLLLAAEPHFRYFALSGLESGFAAALGLACAAALLDGRRTLAGILLGLAVWNKLDAGLLALAVGGTWLCVDRRPPIRIVWVSVLTVLPWFLFAAVYFGSPIPNSLTTKLAGGEGLAFDPLWAVRFLRHEWRWVSVLAGLLWIARWRHAEAPERLVVGTLGGWFALHLLALSATDLGAPYPWYLVVLIPPAVILGASAVAGLESRWLRLAAAGLVALPLSFWIPPALAGPSRWLKTREAFEVDRREAGRFLARHSSPDEVVSSGFGWVAYEVPNPFNDVTGLNSREMLEPVMYTVHHGMPFDRGGVPPSAPPGRVLLATFDSAHRRDPNYSWFAVYGRPDSRIAREIAHRAKANAPSDLPHEGAPR